MSEPATGVRCGAREHEAVLPRPDVGPLTAGLSLPIVARDEMWPKPPPRRLKVALVNMPWARVDAPSIQCGTLASAVRLAGHECDVHYLNLDFAAVIGAASYNGIAVLHFERLHLLGEWLFSFAAFGEVTAEVAYVEEFPEVLDTWARLFGADLPGLIDFRRETVPNWLRSRVEAVDWARYDVIGFSSTFFQNTASLALGKLLKERLPAGPLIYGGANFDGEMGREFQRHLPWLDYVVVGEGDISFPALLDALARDTSVRVPGVYCRDSAGTIRGEGEAVRVRDLNRLPVPDYRDYFDNLDRLGRDRILGEATVKIPVEFSRGCWWGEKHHCTFCGLNALGMAYRAKSSPRAIGELATLLNEYPAVHIEAVDNILDMKHLATMCTDLAGRHWDASIFFEVKANLTREQLATVRRAGIHRIQPGIESLSSHVLRLMRKGSSKLINIRLLKWARYYGIMVDWNVLTGFPGEREADYLEQAALIPHLVHLEPPAGCGPIWLERFSPYFTDRSLGMSNVRPRPCYGYIYPHSIDHMRIAYFFDYDATDPVDGAAREALMGAVQQWRDRWTEGDRRPNLIYQRLPGKITIIDRRTAEPRRAVLTGWWADAYELCGDAPRSVAGIHRDLSADYPTLTTAEIASFLGRCCRSGVVVEDEGRFLSLAIPENPDW